MKKIIVGDCFDDGQPPPIVIDDTHPYADHCFQIVNCLGDLPIYLDRYELQARYKSLPTLHLPISEPWFSRILSGEKTEEYRDNKPYYVARFKTISNPDKDLSFWYYVKDGAVLHLTNGYGHHRPQLWAHIKEITIGRGKPELGAPEHDVFIIKLGEVFHSKNLKVVN